MYGVQVFISLLSVDMDPAMEDVEKTKSSCFKDVAIAAGWHMLSLVRGFMQTEYLPKFDDV